MECKKLNFAWNINLVEKERTIAAIATPPGQGAVAMIRVSGEKAVVVCGKIFIAASGPKGLENLAPNRVRFGRIHDNGNIIDEVLITLFRAPHSYTGEDLVEISCHGSVFIQQKILQILINNGASHAKPGEFTQRAFLNGKMDLAQAEAVADLIASESAAFHKVAMQQMRGGISSELKNLRDRLLNFISLIELELDFSEEDVEFADRSDLRELLEVISGILGSLAGSFVFGNAVKNGIPVVIAGKPNAGKSTLLNNLLREEKALVSEIPGTTRDSIEDVIHLEGLAFRFIDTAGIRETTDKVEIMGIKRTMEKMKLASVILLIAEATDSPEHICHLLEGLKSKPGLEDKPYILLLNKSDLLETNEAKDSLPSLGKKDSVLRISAIDGSGIEELKKRLVDLARKGKPGESDVVVTNIRHYEALKKAHEATLRASTGLQDRLSGELLAFEIREVLHFLGEITGEITTDEILGNIFRNFCIGK